MFDPEEGDIVIIGEAKLLVTGVQENAEDYAFDEALTITLENRDAYTIFEDKSGVQGYIREYWTLVGDNDPDELIDHVGPEQIIEWAYNGGLDNWIEDQAADPTTFFEGAAIEAQYVGREYKGNVVLYLCK